MANPKVSTEVRRKRGTYRADRDYGETKPRPKRVPRVKTFEPPPEIDPAAAIMLLPGFDPHRDSAGFTFDPERATEAIDFFHEQLVHVKGAKSRTPFWLEHWQQGIIANLFGWYSDETGCRRFRESLIFVARKNGKTPLAAGILLYLLFIDDEYGAEIYGAASEYKQATLVFEHARGMVLLNPELAGRCKVYQGQAKSIQLGEDEGFSTYRVICSNDQAAHGFNTHAAVIDELHTQRDRELVDALITSTGARDNPLIVHITTSDFDREASICNEKHEYACRVRDGIVRDASFLPVIYEATEADDWTDPEVWRKANPNMGISVAIDYLERECQRAQETPTYENTFKRLHLNIRTSQDIRWLQMARWDVCDSVVDPTDLRGASCFGGLDMASTTDVAAFVLYFPETGAVVPHFWVPRANAESREKRDRVPYLTWARQGLVTLTPGNSIDAEQIIADVIGLAGQHQIEEIAFDRWGSDEVRRELSREGITMIDFGQGFASMSAPTKELERLVLASRLAHGGNPVLRWMANNVTVETDAAGNLKPNKKRSSEKIDGIVALVMAIGRAMQQEPTRFVYNTRGLREL